MDDFELLFAVWRAKVEDDEDWWSGRVSVARGSCLGLVCEEEGEVEENV